MKSFINQYLECKKHRKQKTGPLEKFKDNPGILPAPWHPAAKLAAEALKKNPDAGIHFTMCKRFGGICRSRKPECVALRSKNYAPEEWRKNQ